MSVNQIETFRERESALEHLESILELPMNILAFVWLVLTIVELSVGLPPLLEDLTTLIWVLFWFDYLIKFCLAPQKATFVKRNWITLLALILPALRIFRALRFVRLLRGGQTVRVVSTFNRGMMALRRSLRHRGFGYVAALTLMVNLLGAAGIYALERGSGPYMADFGTALWWVAMMLTTMGADYFPKTPEGRILSLLLATYGFAVFGYVTASVASFFVDRDASSDESLVANEESIRKLHEKIDLLANQITKLTNNEGPQR
jgi:voltage-gated potassium channel